VGASTSIEDDIVIPVLGMELPAHISADMTLTTVTEVLQNDRLPGLTGPGSLIRSETATGSARADSPEPSPLWRPPEPREPLSGHPGSPKSRGRPDALSRSALRIPGRNSDKHACG